jgi:hypothetical protein
VKVLDTFFVQTKLGEPRALDELLEPFITLFSSFQHIYSPEAFSRLLLFPLQCLKYSHQFSTEELEDFDDSEEDIKGSIRTLLQVTF